MSKVNRTSLGHGSMRLVRRRSKQRNPYLYTFIPRHRNPSTYNL